MKRHTTKLLGVSLLALVGLMAIGAAGAQATITELLIEGSKLSTLGGSEKIAGTVGNGDLLTVSYEIGCKKGTIAGEVKANTITGLEGKVSILFEECSVLGSPQCDVENSSDGKLGHITASAKISFLLHNGVYYVLFKPLIDGGTLSLIKIHDLGGCTLFEDGECLEVTGATAVRVQTPEVEETPHTVSTLTAAEETLLASAVFNFALFLGQESAMLKEGTNTTVKLNGGHAGKKFSLMMF